jgi:hypothetical protein
MQDHTRKELEMKGKGYYSANTRGARNVITNSLPLILVPEGNSPLIQSVPQGATVFRIADLAAADGGTSQEFMRGVVAELHKYFPHLEICITYTDRPSNDFNALFSLLTDSNNTESPLSGNPLVFIYASGRSFYERNFESGSLNFGFSATAMHWLSEMPVKMKHHIHSVTATQEERKIISEQAAKDWETILLHRVAELAVGGRLLLVNFTQDSEGQYLGKTTYKDSMFDVLNQIWREMSEGDNAKITPQEYEDTNFPQYYRTQEEFLAPFNSNSSSTSSASLIIRNSLVVDTYTTKVVKCPYREEFDEGITTADEFASALVKTVRSWSEGVFMAGLDKAKRPSVEERVRIVDELYKRYEERIKIDPTRHGMDYVHFYLLLHKKE